MKNAASFVLASLKASTYRGTYASAPKTLGAHRLAPVRKRDAHYSSRRGPRCGLAGSLFDHLLESMIA